MPGTEQRAARRCGWLESCGVKSCNHGCPFWFCLNKYKAIPGLLGGSITRETHLFSKKDTYACNIARLLCVYPECSRQRWLGELILVKPSIAMSSSGRHWV